GRYARLQLTQENAFVTQRIVLQDSAFVTVAPRYTTHLFGLSVDRDTRDDALNPTRGATQSLSGQIAGGPLKGTSSFTKWQASAGWYLPVRTDWVFAARIRAGRIDPFGSTEVLTQDTTVEERVNRVPPADRFRIGGVNSLRGYNENEIPPGGGLAL